MSKFFAGLNESLTEARKRPLPVPSRLLPSQEASASMRLADSIDKSNKETKDVLMRFLMFIQESEERNRAAMNAVINEFKDTVQNILEKLTSQKPPQPKDFSANIDGVAREIVQASSRLTKAIADNRVEIPKVEFPKIDMPSELVVKGHDGTEVLMEVIKSLESMVASKEANIVPSVESKPVAYSFSVERDKEGLITSIDARPKV